MSRLIASPIPAGVINAQRRAAAPGQSVWVSANAGSGKTHVLTERVLRLLLSQVKPEEILCLTYTKAAAAVMRTRLAERLGHWALADDAVLAADLTRLEGALPPSEMLHRARTLFAHALDTPGGLKIVTIHAFAESVLHRFPVEAGVPFDFTVIEEADREDMIRAAHEQVMASGLKGIGPASAAVETLFELLSDDQIKSAIDCALADGRKLRPLLADREAAKARLRRLTGFSGATLAGIDAEISAGYLLSRADHVRVAGLATSKTGKAFAERLAVIDAAAPDPAALCRCFLTGAGTVPKSGFPDKAIRDGAPDLTALLVAEAQRLEGLCAERLLAGLVARSEALTDLLGAIHDAYETGKRRHSRLDFDDLIDRTSALFENQAAAWVRYKLDAAVTHVMVDESQDTNPEQWRVIEALVEEFFAGMGAVERQRTVFGVGDEKQSIYSFQGADPRVFGEFGRRYHRRSADAGLAFENVKLRTSFRSLPGILAAVDAVFARDDIREAVLAPPDDPVIHATARAEAGGTVTLWPPLQQRAEAVEGAPWPLAAPDGLDKSAERQVAERIAREIAGWVRTGRTLGPRQRPVRFDDILILVQSRAALFQEIVRALSGAEIPTPGADRLSVTSHIAVLDLMALGDVLINTAEDLQLAALLRSPLFDVSEDDLLEIAHERPGTLWQALERSEIAAARAAFAKLHQWRGALDFERPYEFYAHILYAEGGLRRFHARLGPEVDDVFSEFLALALAHEQSDQPSLQGFLAEMRQRHISIRRELPEQGGGVRVMTVHGAKGLEAPIVILADAATQPSGRQLAKPVVIADPGTGLVLVHGSKDQHVEETLALKQEAEKIQRQEYWRKLYVAMTRAEDELYVTGPLTPGKDADKQQQGSWYEALAAALAPAAEAERDAEGRVMGLHYPAPRPAAAAAPGQPAAAPAVQSALHLPPLPACHRREIVRPSSAWSGSERILDTAAQSVLDAETARREGLALHALLQHLGRVPRAAWPEVGLKAMPVLLPDRPDRHAGVLARAASILTRPELAHLFGDDSRAEVPFLIEALRDGVPVTLAGRIDRLVVSPPEVLVIDFKSDANPPVEAAAIPPAYRRQLALYALVATRLCPAMIVRSAILWTALESLMFLPAPMLAESAGGFTMR